MKIKNNLTRKTKKNGEFKIETPKNFSIDKLVCLRSKVYSFKCKNNDENKNKIKGISKSQSKHIKSEEDKKMFRWRRISKRK